MEFQFSWWAVGSAAAVALLALLWRVGARWFGDRPGLAFALRIAFASVLLVVVLGFAMPFVARASQHDLFSRCTQGLQGCAQTLIEMFQGRR